MGVNPHRDKPGTIPMDVVLSFRIADPEESATILEAIAPTLLPRFNGMARVVIGTDVRDLHRWLEDGDPFQDLPKLPPGFKEAEGSMIDLLGESLDMVATAIGRRRSGVSLGTDDAASLIAMASMGLEFMQRMEGTYKARQGDGNTRNADANPDGGIPPGAQ